MLVGQASADRLLIPLLLTSSEIGFPVVSGGFFLCWKVWMLNLAMFGVCCAVREQEVFC